MRKVFLAAISCLLFSQAKAYVDTVVIRSSPANSMFRYIDNAPADTGSNYSGNGMVIARWTAMGTPYTWRSLLKFDLSTVPSGSLIDSAFLSVYANTASPSGNPGSPTWGTDNAVGIYRLTSAWDTSTLTWGTQPAYSTTNGDTLAQSTTWTQDYTHVDVTDLVRDEYTMGNHGFLFKHLQEVTTLNSMIFYSPGHYSTDSTLTPKLVIYYTNTVDVVDKKKNATTFTLYPNPANKSVTVAIDKEIDKVVTVSLIDIMGRVVSCKQIDKLAGHIETSIDVSTLSKGLYMVRRQDADGFSITKKLVVE